MGLTSFNRARREAEEASQTDAQTEASARPKKPRKPQAEEASQTDAQAEPKPEGESK
jgi:cell division septation protein DedD